MNFNSRQLYLDSVSVSFHFLRQLLSGRLSVRPRHVVLYMQANIKFPYSHMFVKRVAVAFAILGRLHAQTGVPIVLYDENGYFRGVYSAADS